MQRHSGPSQIEECVFPGGSARRRPHAPRHSKSSHFLPLPSSPSPLASRPLSATFDDDLPHHVPVPYDPMVGTTSVAHSAQRRKSQLFLDGQSHSPSRDSWPLNAAHPTTSRISLSLDKQPQHPHQRLSRASSHENLSRAEEPNGRRRLVKEREKSRQRNSRVVVYEVPPKSLGSYILWCFRQKSKQEPITIEVKKHLIVDSRDRYYLNASKE